MTGIDIFSLVGHLRSMVATVESPAILRPRQYMSGQGYLSVDQKIKIRTLYLVGNLGPKEISDQLKCNYKAAKMLITNAGWAKIRGKKWEKAEAIVTDIVEKDLAEVSQRIAVESEELTLGSLNLLRSSLSPGSPEFENLPIEKKLRTMESRAKIAQAASGAVRNLVGVSRTCRGMDNKATEPTGSSTNVNLFVFATPAAAKTERNVTPNSVQIASSSV